MSLINSLLDLINPDGCKASTSEVRVPHPYMSDTPDYVCNLTVVMGWFAVGLAIFTLYHCVRVGRQLRTPAIRPSGTYYLMFGAFVWSVAAPIWFWFEFWGLYMRHGDEHAMTQLRHSQQLSAAVWAGVLAVTILILNRALSRSPNIIEGARKDQSAFFIYGGWKSEPFCSPEKLTLLWSGDEREMAEAKLAQFRKRDQFGYIHLSERNANGNDTKITTFELNHA